MKRFATIGEFHEFRQLPRPEHPLLSINEIEVVKQAVSQQSVSWCYDFYCIGLKRVTLSPSIKFKYGQQPFDFNEGLMSFVAPSQVLRLFIETDAEVVKQSGWLLCIHPDFLWNTALAKTIKQYDFWNYSVHESLFLSAREEAIIINIFKNIRQEYHSNIDKFSKQIIISQIESLLIYSDRFYHRQFITREKSNHQILNRLEALLADYFREENLSRKGLPTVQMVADELHVSPKYLSTMLTLLTGQSTRQHIHEKLIEKAKVKLSTTNLSVSEVAYELGFEHPQSFSKLFKQRQSKVRWSLGRDLTEKTVS